ncbi:MAG: SDR family oxidoreductase [Butyricicoccus pullicaecorum]|nr:SDR family oxidoreductase [Butyricicoccus pullicaecorum]
MNKTVWITGGSRGIGAACVHAFAEAGWKVAFCYHSRTEDAERVAAQTGALAIRCDLTKREQVNACAAQIRKTLGAIGAVVCNAGVAQQKMFCDLTDADWDFVMDNNLRSVFYTIQAALPDLVHEKEGAIVTVSSVWGQTGASCESHYAASKAGLIGLSKSLAHELGLSGIRVNCVAPGVIDTEMNQIHDAEVLRQLAADTDLGRLGRAQEVARTIRYLCSEDASFVTGQVLGVTGGFVI